MAKDEIARVHRHSVVAQNLFGLLVFLVGVAEPKSFEAFGVFVDFLEYRVSILQLPERLEK